MERLEKIKELKRQGFSLLYNSTDENGTPSKYETTNGDMSDDLLDFCNTVTYKEWLGSQIVYRLDWIGAHEKGVVNFYDKMSELSLVVQAANEPIGDCSFYEMIDEIKNPPDYIERSNYRFE